MGGGAAKRFITAFGRNPCLITFHNYLRYLQNCTAKTETERVQFQQLEDIFHATISTISAARAQERKINLFVPGLNVADELGRLIAIMLGRLRMTVPDCLTEFENIADRVYSKPRFFHRLNLGVIDRSKYNGADLKELFEDVTRRRSEKVSTSKRILFPSKRGLCKTLVSLSFPYPILVIQSSARDP